MTQPEALRLADLIRSRHGNDLNDEAAAELRRLHAEVERLTLNGIHSCHAECQRPVCRLTRQRDALLEALRAMRVKYGQYACRVCDLADAAIKAVEGEKA